LKLRSPSPLKNELVSNTKLQKNIQNNLKTKTSEFNKTKNVSNNITTTKINKNDDKDKMNTSIISYLTNTSVVQKDVSSKNNSSKANIKLPLEKKSSGKTKSKLYYKSDSSESPKIRTNVKKNDANLNSNNKDKIKEADKKPTVSKKFSGVIIFQLNLIGSIKNKRTNFKR